MKLPKKIWVLMCVTGVAVTAPQAWADEAKPIPKTATKYCKVNRLRPHEPSYAVYQKAEGDEYTLRAHYSFRYMLAPLQEPDTVKAQPGEACLIPGKMHYEWYLKYTGEFDFYAGTRDSGPVINRISNPAMHYRWNFPGEHPGVVNWIDVGVEHLSDGQTTEVKSASEIAQAQQAYARDDHKYFDSISRGMNFFSLETMLADSKDHSSSRLYAKVRYYFHKDTDITWGPLADSGTTISDYARLRLLWSQNVGDGEASLAWTLGDKGLGTDSWDLDYLFNKRSPWTWYVRYHHGPLQTLSNYTQERQSLGIGLKFTP